MNESKVNLFIVGAAKAGTTSLYSYLELHPKVFMCPIKEPHYFSKDIRCENFTQEECFNACFNMKKYLESEKLKEKHIAFVDNLEQYEQLFRNAYDETFRGEASTGYLYSCNAAEEIYRYNPKSKIIMVLREPVSRAYSHWKMNVAGGRENLSEGFIASVNKDFHREHKGYCVSHLYIELGQYAQQLSRYMALFPKENIKVILYEELNNSAEVVMSSLESFLNIGHELIELGERKNLSSMPTFPRLIKTIKALNIQDLIPGLIKNRAKRLLYSSSSQAFPKLSHAQIKGLYANHFKEDIDCLEHLLERDFSQWKHL